MPKRLKRIYGFGDLHFITFSCYRRLPLLASTRSRNVFVRVLDQVRREYVFQLVGYVVMPELGYMHANPVKRGLVDGPKRWPWSSYAFYQQRGEVLISIDPVE